VITALLNDAIKAEEFEKAVKYRKYRVLLDELKVAINNEEFDKCIDLKKKKLEMETEMPEIDVKKKQLESAPPSSARKVAAGDRVSQSDDSDESVVKGGRLAAAATAKARLAGGGSAAPSPVAAPGAAKPAVKLSAAELESRWAKFAPKAPARPAGAGAKDDSAVNRTSWDGGFTLQNAAAQAGAGGKKPLEEDSESRQTLDESGDEVLLDKKDKKSKDGKPKKKKKDKDAKAKKGAAPKKKMSVMSSTWAVDLGGASLAEMAKEKAKAKNARINTTTKTKKKKKKVKTEKNDDSGSLVQFKPGANKLKALEDEDTDLISPKPALKTTNSKPVISGGLSRAADAPDAAEARKAYETRLAMARTANSARDTKDAGTPEKKSVGFFTKKK